MAYLAAIAAGSGVPLFTRTKGDLPPLAYPKLASLNGAHFFSSSLEAQLRSCTSGGVKTVWKTFCNNITLILVATDDGSCDDHMTYLLELVFNAMVMVIGLQDLDTPTNMERLKQNLKWCYPLVDHIMEQTDLLSPVTRCVDVIACEDTNLLQVNYVYLRSVGGSWRPLKRAFSLSSSPPLPLFTAKDIPVYLPVASNKIPHRLLVFAVKEGVELCILCDSGPSLVDIEMTIENYWSGVSDSLKACVRSYPRCFPGSLTFDPSVLGACLINMESGRCLSTFSPSPGTETPSTLSAGFRGNVTAAKKREYFTRFYKTVVNQFLPSPSASLTDKDEKSTAVRDTIPHQIRQTYTCTTPIQGLRSSEREIYLHSTFQHFSSHFFTQEDHGRNVSTDNFVSVDCFQHHQASKDTAYYLMYERFFCHFIGPFSENG
ncbi:Protein fuzzy homolog [Geodia barretti]|uniref:Protein fuzzy homolog n=1 Tax=Geodia barretti TaxID=519541 RepID=A0AA35SQ60_GEOBA|nr:Protein fuzzy homolog [Geodia barretti]